MNFKLVPMLQIQRDIYNVPRGLERFYRYFEVMMGDTADLALPLPAMNPMGKEHVIMAYDALLALDAEGVAAAALADVEQRLSHLTGSFRMGLVVADDAQGGWTNRYFTDFGHRFDSQPMLRRGWAVVLFWTSEQPSVQRVREEVMLVAFRTASVCRHGWPTTLRQMLEQEGQAALFAGLQQPIPAAEKLDDIRERIRPYLDSTDFPTIFACLYGDEAASSAGYPALGLPPYAGIALAVHEARRRSPLAGLNLLNMPGGS